MTQRRIDLSGELGRHIEPSTHSPLCECVECIVRRRESWHNTDRTLLLAHLRPGDVEVNLEQVSVPRRCVAWREAVVVIGHVHSQEIMDELRLIVMTNDREVRDRYFRCNPGRTLTQLTAHFLNLASLLVYDIERSR